MKKYPLFKAHLPIGSSLFNIREVFESGFVNEGEQVTRLTLELSKKLASNQLVLTNSCTSALTLALHLAGVDVGDEVITTSMTCVATNTPIIAAKANIVWADIDSSTGMIDPLSVAAKLTPKTKAVIAVAWAGTPPELMALYQLCNTHGISLILDAAHAFGAEYKNLPIHKWAHFTTYSFQAIKHFTTGDGGGLVCTRQHDYERSKALKWFGLDRDKAKDEKGDWKGQQWDVDVVEAGYKFNMNNMSAALGLAQLPHIDMLIEKHRSNAVSYDSHFAGYSLAAALERPVGAKSSFWVYTMKLSNKANITRDDLLQELNNVGIMAGVVHVPNDEYSAFTRFKANLPGTVDFSSRQFSLPCGWWLSPDDIEHIATTVKELIK